jgi:hypothetical protein
MYIDDKLKEMILDFSSIKKINDLSNKIYEIENENIQRVS